MAIPVIAGIIAKAAPVVTKVATKAAPYAKKAGQFIKQNGQKIINDPRTKQVMEALGNSEPNATQNTNGNRQPYTFNAQENSQRLGEMCDNPLQYAKSHKNELLQGGISFLAQGVGINKDAAQKIGQAFSFRA